MKTKIHLLIIFAILLILTSCDGKKSNNNENFKSVENELIPKELIGWHRALISENKTVQEYSTKPISLLYLKIDYSNTEVYYFNEGYFFYGTGYIANKENEDNSSEIIVADVEGKNRVRKHFVLKYYLVGKNYKLYLKGVQGQPEIEFSKIENQVTESSFLLDAKNSL